VFLWKTLQEGAGAAKVKEVNETENNDKSPRWASIPRPKVYETFALPG
jgi:hypothetical protein